MNMNKPGIDLDAPIWRLEEIASFLRLPSTKAAYPVVKLKGFPRSVLPASRNRRWIAAEVKEFFASSTSESQPIKAIPGVNSEPQIIHKQRKVRAA